jgi:hypothetical protein
VVRSGLPWWVLVMGAAVMIDMVRIMVMMTVVVVVVVL